MNDNSGPPVVDPSVSTVDTEDPKPTIQTRPPIILVITIGVEPLAYGIAVPNPEIPCGTI